MKMAQSINQIERTIQTEKTVWKVISEPCAMMILTIIDNKLKYLGLSLKRTGNRLDNAVI